MKKTMVLCLLAFRLGAADYHITSFGAVGDGRTVNTAAVQAAVDAASHAGGGRVVIPTGEFLTGTLIVKSNVELHLEAGAVLKGSPNLDDYELSGIRRGVIFAADQRNITLSGHGVIDGNGTIFFDPQKPHWGPDFDRQFTRQGEKYMDFSGGIEDGPIAYTARPGMMAVFIRCEGVTIEDLTLRDSAEWCVRIGDCDGVRVHGITILNNPLVPNSDGIHCTTSRNVRISDCDIRAGDDAVIVTGFGADIDVHGNDRHLTLDYAQRAVGNKTGYAENVTVTNCVLQSRSSGVRIGYGQTPIRNCVFSTLVIHDSNRGLGVFARDAGSIQNILFSNIIIRTRLHTGHWWGNGEPIHVSAIAQNKSVPVGGVSDIRFENIVAESEAGILLYGATDRPLQNLVLKDVTLKIVAGRHTASYGGNFDLRPAADLKDGIFAHDIPGLFAKDIEGLTIADFNLVWSSGLPTFFSHGIEAESVNGLRIDRFDGEAAPNSAYGKAIHLTNCRPIDP